MESRWQKCQVWIIYLTSYIVIYQHPPGLLWWLTEKCQVMNRPIEPPSARDLTEGPEARTEAGHADGCGDW